MLIRDIKKIRNKSDGGISVDEIYVHICTISSLVRENIVRPPAGVLTFRIVPEIM